MSLTRRQRQGLSGHASLVEHEHRIDPQCPAAADIAVQVHGCGCSVVYQYLHSAAVGVDASPARATATHVTCPCGGGLTTQPARTSRIVCGDHLTAGGASCDDCVSDGVKAAIEADDARVRAAEAARAEQARAEQAERIAADEAARRAELAATPVVFPSETGCGCLLLIEGGDVRVSACDVHAVPTG